MAGQRSSHVQFEHRGEGVLDNIPVWLQGSGGLTRKTEARNLCALL